MLDKHKNLHSNEIANLVVFTRIFYKILSKGEKKPCVILVVRFVNLILVVRFVNFLNV
jgi:hypothetical protein